MVLVVISWKVGDDVEPGGKRGKINKWRVSSFRPKRAGPAEKLEDTSLVPRWNIIGFPRLYALVDKAVS